MPLSKLQGSSWRRSAAQWLRFGCVCAFWVGGRVSVGAQDPAARTITPVSVVVDSAAKRAYAVDEANGRVVVLDTMTGARSYIKVGAGPDALALDAGARRLYVVNAGSGTVSVIDTATEKGVAELKTDRRPYTVAVDARRHRTFVSNTFSDEVTEIDGATNGVTRQPWGSKDAIVVDEARGRVFFSSYEDPKLLMLDETTGTTKGIPAAVHIWAMAVAPNDGMLYAAVIGADVLLAIDPSSGETRRIEVGRMPDAIAIDGVKRRGYVANRESNTLTVLDLRDRTVVATVTVGARPGAIAVDERSALVYVASTAAGTVGVINEACSGKPVAEVPVGEAPYALAVGSKGEVVVALMGAKAVTPVHAPMQAVTCARP